MHFTLTLTSPLSTHSDATINYQARQHAIDFVLHPYYGAANLTFAQAQQTLQLQYRKTLLYFDRRDVPTSGLDALGVRPPTPEFGSLPALPPVPVPNATFAHLSVDAEGLVLDADGTCVFFPCVVASSSTLDGGSADDC